MDNRSFEAGANASAPTSPATPSAGYPTDGVPGSTPATVPGAFWFHQMGEEIRSVIVAAGLTPVVSALNQLYTAITTLITSFAPPKPQTGAGVGQFVQLYGNGVGVNTLVLPSGGTWVYWYETNNGTGNIILGFGGIAAGGTALNNSQVNYYGWAWRIA